MVSYDADGKPYGELTGIWNSFGAIILFLIPVTIGMIVALFV